MDRMQRVMKQKDGFSLIEVIVAVAILAILSMPILLYFTNSAIHSANGKYEQAADLAAQTIVEEIDSINDFEAIETALINTGRDWTLTETAADINGTTKLSRPVSVDGNDYIADVSIDYGPYSSVVVNPSPTPGGTNPPESTPSSSLKAKYNAYQNPHFQELYSDESVVISEKKDTFEIGLNNLYYELNGNAEGEVAHEKVPMDDPSTGKGIKQKIKKAYKLSVIAYPAGMYTVKGSCVFGYDTNGNGVIDSADPANAEPTTEVVVSNTQIEKDKLKNLYFLFQPTYGEGEISGATVSQNVIVDFQTLIETGGVNRAENLEISFIRQNTYTIGSDNKETVDPTKEFRLKMDTSTGIDGQPKSKNHTVSKYFTNDKVVLENGVASNGLLNRTQDKRIATVTVDIYKMDETGNKEGDVLVTNTTSKAV